MILLNRITPFAITFLGAIGFALLLYYPRFLILALLILSIGIPLLLARLLKWDFRRGSFWIFLGIPVFFLGSSIFFFLFLESSLAKIFLTLSFLIGIWFFTENIFTFYHLPSAYQAYSLEYLSLVMSLASVFFLANGAYASMLFLHLPVWVPALVIFWTGIFLCLCVFWVSKIAIETAILFAVAGGIILTELFIVLAMLPTGFSVNAAALCTCLYVYLGLSRAHILDKLTGVVIRRYVGAGFILLFLLFLTTRWV